MKIGLVMELIGNEYWFQYKFNKRSLESKFYIELFLIICLSVYVYEVKDLLMISDEKVIIAKVVILAMLLSVTLAFIAWKILKLLIFMIVDKLLLVLVSFFAFYIMGYILLGTIIFIISIYSFKKKKYISLEKFSKWDYQKNQIRQKNLIAKLAVPFILLFEFTIGFNEKFWIIVFILGLVYVIIWSSSYEYSFTEYLRHQKKSIVEMERGLKLHENQHGKINIRKKIRTFY